MAYFTAVLSHSSGGYRAVDYDIRDAANLDDLLETMRSGGEDEGEALGWPVGCLRRLGMAVVSKIRRRAHFSLVLSLRFAARRTVLSRP